jgi:hypothetical protein
LNIEFEGLNSHIKKKTSKKSNKSKSSDPPPQPNPASLPERSKKYQSVYITTIFGILLEIQALTIDSIADQPQGT